MYYYILESPTSRGIRQSYQRLRDILTNLGIAGEMVGASPARMPEELAMMGLEKGYSTIVAVGGDHFINEIASIVVGQAVLGVVPIEASKEVTDLIGVSSLKDAAEALRHRRISEVNTVMAEPNNTIFLTAHLQPQKLAKVSLVVDNRYRAYAYFHHLTVSRNLEVHFYSQHLTEPKKVLGLFTSGGKIIKSESSLHGRSIRIVTDPELPLTIANRPVARTPIQLKLIPNSLRVITKRGTII